MRIITAGAVLMGLAGCGELRTDGAIRADHTVDRPTQAGSARARADDVETVIDGYGRVRGHWRVLAAFPEPLWAAPDPNRTVEPCRAAIEAAASAEGPVRVEAAGRGPELRLRGGGYAAAVEVRVVYALGTVRLVRQATMVCRVRPDGSFAGAELYPDQAASAPGP